MIEERAAGGVVFRRRTDRAEIVLIKDRYGKWTLPKGKLEPGEDSVTAALREIAEETGVRGEIVETLLSVNYQYQDDKRGTIDKSVDYFLVRALNDQIIPQPGEVLDIRWVGLLEADQLCEYANNLSALEKARLFLRKENI